jgi:hypothetical protein
MQQTHILVGIVVRSARWGLPWIGVLALSASFAYAMNVVAGGGPSAQGAQLGVAVTPGPAESSPTMLFVGDDYAGFVCVGPGGDRWLPTAGRCDTTSQEPTIDLNTTGGSAEPTLTPRPDSAW